MNTPLHSTRLFPRGRGADAYQITGIAACCDWVVLTDSRAPQAMLVRRQPTDRPRHIFLSLREPFRGLAFLMQEVLPQLSEPFVLVSGSEDVTLPRQTDRRWRGFDQAEDAMIAALLQNPLLLHWFAENLVDDSHPRMSALPLGMVTPQGPAPSGLLPAVPALADRPLRVLCAHRIRPGPQWDTRRRVTGLAQGPWADWTTVLTEELPEADFLRQIEQHAFVLCVEGGGIDPSPKAWHSLIHGAIPIIRSTGLQGAYRQLPVACVDDWHPGALTPALLAQWRDERLARMDPPAARLALQCRLTLDYWWQKIASRARDGAGQPAFCDLSVSGSSVSGKVCAR